MAHASGVAERMQPGASPASISGASTGLGGVMEFAFNGIKSKHQKPTGPAETPLIVSKPFMLFPISMS